MQQQPTTDRWVAQRSALPRSTTPPVPIADRARQAASFGDPAAAALSSGLATLDPDGAVVFAAPPASPTEVAVPAYAGVAPTVQRAPEEAPGPAGPTGESPSGVPAPVPGGGTAQSNEQLEELAKNLYDKIRERLKAELRLDRERWGRVTDLAR